MTDTKAPVFIAKYRRLIDYINNTGRVPLPVAAFDEDHDPIGPMMRRGLVDAGLIQQRDDGIYLRPDLVRSGAKP